MKFHYTLMTIGQVFNDSLFEATNDQKSNIKVAVPRFLKTAIMKYSLLSPAHMAQHYDMVLL